MKDSRHRTRWKRLLAYLSWLPLVLIGLLAVAFAWAAVSQGPDAGFAVAAMLAVWMAALVILLITGLHLVVVAASDLDARTKLLWCVLILVAAPVAMPAFWLAGESEAGTGARGGRTGPSASRSS